MVAEAKVPWERHAPLLIKVEEDEKPLRNYRRGSIKGESKIIRFPPSAESSSSWIRDREGFPLVWVPESASSLRALCAVFFFLV